MDTSKNKIIQKIKRALASNSLLFGTVAGAVFGFLLGLLLKPYHKDDVVRSLVGYPGELFMRALQLLIIPVVVFSLIQGSASLNIKTNGKIALRTCSYFIITSLGNAALGAFLAVTFHPGDASIKTALQDDIDPLSITLSDRKNTLLDNFLDLGRNIVPNNLFTSFFEMATTTYTAKVDAAGHEYFVKSLGSRRGLNAIGIIFYSLMFGSVMSLLEDKAKPLKEIIKAVDEINLRSVSALIWLTPCGVASLICAKVMEVDDMGKIMSSLAMFILVVIFGIILYQLIFIQLLYFLFVRKNPFRFFTKLLPAVVTGFATDSSAATLPVTLKCLDEIGVDARVSRFVVPIGVTCNMDGTALFHGISSIFIAQMNNVPLGMGDYMTICVTATAVSIAAAGAPSASLTLLPIILNAIGAPVEDIGLLFAIDWLCDRIRTTNNVLGDAYTCAIVEKWSQVELKGNGESQDGATRKDLKKLDSNGYVHDQDKLGMSSVVST